MQHSYTAQGDTRIARSLYVVILLLAWYYLAWSQEPHAPPIAWSIAEIKNYAGLRSDTHCDAVTTCGRYQGRLLLILILHSVMHDITSTLPVSVNLPLGFNAKWPPHVNRRRAPGVLRLGFIGYMVLLLTILYNWNILIPCPQTGYKLMHTCKKKYSNIF